MIVDPEISKAQRSRAPIRDLADYVSFYFVPSVVLLAIVAFVAWALFGPDPTMVFATVAAVSVLIIACAVESAGITLVKGNLSGIVRARILAEATIGSIKQNLFFAFAYNAAGMPLCSFRFLVGCPRPCWRLWQ